MGRLGGRGSTTDIHGVDHPKGTGVGWSAAPSTSTMQRLRHSTLVVPTWADRCPRPEGPWRGEAYDYIPAHSPIPPLYSTEDDPDPIAHIHVFCPTVTMEWWLTEYSEVADDGTTHLGFGLVASSACPHGELGYVSLAELAQIREPFGGLPPERELGWTPARLSEVRKRLG